MLAATVPNLAGTVLNFAAAVLNFAVIVFNSVAIVLIRAFKKLSIIIINRVDFYLWPTHSAVGQNTQILEKKLY